MKEEIKLKFISFVQTFVSSFLTILGTLAVTISPELLSNPEAWSKSAVVAVVLGAVRAALKVAWEKSMPLSLGGKV